VNVGTVGHVDHGKTTLTAALTKVSADKGYGTKYVAYDEVAKASESQGRAVYSMEFAHYDEVPKSKAEEIVAKSNPSTR
jgi:translation elongation factor EF-Tu-like GTPase